MVAFKVRNRTTGLYLCKGVDAWSKRGKVWAQLSHLKSALCPIHKEVPANWEIVVLAEAGSINCDVVLNADFKEADVLEAIKEANLASKEKYS